MSVALGEGRFPTLDKFTRNLMRTNNDKGRLRVKRHSYQALVSGSKLSTRPLSTCLSLWPTHLCPRFFRHSILLVNTRLCAFPRGLLAQVGALWLLSPLPSAGFHGFHLPASILSCFPEWAPLLLLPAPLEPSPSPSPSPTPSQYFHD